MKPMLYVLLSLPPSPPSFTLDELAIEMYPDRSVSVSRPRLKGFLCDLDKNGWQIKETQSGYLLLDRDQYHLLREWIRLPFRNPPNHFTPSYFRRILDRVNPLFRPQPRHELRLLKSIRFKIYKMICASNYENMLDGFLLRRQQDLVEREEWAIEKG